jgi:chemotaxis response regulator CheB
MSNRDIIVIGGSSGAMTPLREILTDLPADLPAAVFVVLHIPAQGAGLFSTIASAASRIPVLQAQSGTAIKHGHIYLAARITTFSSTTIGSCSGEVPWRTWHGRQSKRRSVPRRCNTGRA